MDPYRMSRAAKRTIDAAAEKAAALGHGRLESVHVLLALLGSKSAPSVALGRAGVTAEALAGPADAVYEGPRGGRARELDRSGGEARELLSAALDEADTSGSTEVGPVHLFLAATADDSWTACRALAELKVDIEALRKDVAALERDEANDALD